MAVFVDRDDDTERDDERPDGIKRVPEVRDQIGQFQTACLLLFLVDRRFREPAGEMIHLMYGIKVDWG